MNICYLLIFVHTFMRKRHIKSIMKQLISAYTLIKFVLFLCIKIHTCMLYDVILLTKRWCFYFLSMHMVSFFSLIRSSSLSLFNLMGLCKFVGELYTLIYSFIQYWICFRIIFYWAQNVC